MKKSPLLNFYILTCLLFLGGCSGVKESLGLTREVPDEFEVSSHQALEVPKNGFLPIPGGSSQALKRVDLTQLILEKKDSSQNQMLSKEEQDFLQELQVNHFPGIRHLVDEEVNVPPPTTEALKEKAKNIVLFWKRKDKKKPAKVISAEEEQRRLEKNAVRA